MKHLNLFIFVALLEMAVMGIASGSAQEPAIANPPPEGIVFENFSTAPTPTPTPPQGNDPTTLVRSAVKKTQSLTRYRFERKLLFQDIEAQRWTCAVQGTNFECSYSVTEGDAPRQLYDLILMDQVLYMRDPNTGAAWKVVANDAPLYENVGFVTNVARDTFTRLLEGQATFIGDDAPFVWKGTEKFGSQSCDRLTQENPPAIGAHYEIWVCPDGYWHRGIGTVSMEAGDMSGLVSASSDVRLYDIGAEITITKPAEIVP